MSTIDGRAIRRHGDAPELLIPATLSAKEEAHLPKWLRKTAPVETAQRVLSPSGISPKTEPPVMTPFGPGREERLRRGTLIHLLFEALPDIAKKDRAQGGDGLSWRNSRTSTPAQRAEMVEAAFGVMDDPKFAAVFGPGGRAEAPVIGRLGSSVINGRVDRLVITDEAILVIDYKTDRPSPPSVGDVGEAYVAQMAAYRAVLAQTWPDRPIRCLLVWTDGPKLMEIPASDLDRVIASARL